MSRRLNRRGRYWPQDRGSSEQTKALSSAERPGMDRDQAHGDISWNSQVTQGEIVIVRGNEVDMGKGKGKGRGRARQKASQIMM